MSEPVVSVIIPVYNGSGFVRDSVGDVFAQDYPSVELVLVNDGSSDDSLEVLRELSGGAPSNVSVKIVDQENGGICAARNSGLDAAGGSYIAFMDQDDRIPSDYISSLVKAMGSEDQMVIGGNVDLDVDTGKRVMRDLDADAEWSIYRNSAPWGRLYRTDIIAEHKIRFELTKISEDFYFNFVYLSYCARGRVKVVPQTGYVWSISKLSESHSKMSKISSDRDVTLILSALLSDMKPIGAESALTFSLFEYCIIKHIVWYLLFVSKGASRDAVTEVYNTCMNWLKGSFPDYRLNPNLKPDRPEGETKRVSFIVRTALLLDRLRLLLPFLIVR